MLQSQKKASADRPLNIGRVEQHAQGLWATIGRIADERSIDNPHARPSQLPGLTSSFYLVGEYVRSTRLKFGLPAGESC